MDANQRESVSDQRSPWCSLGLPIRVNSRSFAVHSICGGYALRIFPLLNFEFPSSFDIRISNLPFEPRTIPNTLAAVPIVNCEDVTPAFLLSAFCFHFAVSTIIVCA
jgi:hypothetical protein